VSEDEESARCLWARNDRNALFTVENYVGYNNRFFLAVFRLAEFFPAAFRLVLKIFSLAAKFGALGVYYGGIVCQFLIYITFVLMSSQVKLPLVKTSDNRTSFTNTLNENKIVKKSTYNKNNATI